MAVRPGQSEDYGAVLLKRRICKTAFDAAGIVIQPCKEMSSIAN
jgi:hypothetical protein